MSGGRLLTLDEQIEHLKAKGITFQSYTEEAAKHFLSEHNYLTKVSAYRKNYTQHPAGPNQGKYVRLDFAHLVDLSTIDMHLRYLILDLCLDIEHSIKTFLINDALANPDEDGYRIVDKFLQYHPDFLDEADRKMQDSYCHDFYFNNRDHLPLWVLMEVISFGELISLYKLYYSIYPDRPAPFSGKLLDNVRNLRNASAHSNCLICHLNREGKVNKVALTKASIAFPWMTTSYRRRYIKKQFTQDFTVLLMAHKSLVTSEGLHAKAREKLRNLFFKRMRRHSNYYSRNPSITEAYNYCRKIILLYFN
ncbi:Abi family protein [Selenomonas ruminantium]|uniref:Abi family protein n=1 Tax=Selenomonas ruminantium TaxID=971 RepID=UPI00041E60B8|nr:Abi family protein [Selenomonas ruminantium]